MADFDPFAQLALLRLQEVDHAIDRVESHLEKLPERAVAASARNLVAQLNAEVGKYVTEVADLELEVAKAESDVEQVRQREARDRGLVDGGSISDSKQLTELTHELETLARRRGDLEEVELEVMERLDASQAELAKARSEFEGANQLLSVAEDNVAAAEAKANDELAALRSDRTAKSAGIVSDLLAIYERIRNDNGGTGAALLRQAQCGGCRMKLSPVAIAAVKAAKPQELIRCEECRVILVRTDESGL